MKTVYWTSSNKLRSNVTAIAPQKVYNIFDKDEYKDTGLLRCPSFIDHLKNMFAVTSPVDLTVFYNQESHEWGIDEINTRVHTLSVRSAAAQFFSLYLPYLFVAEDDDITMEVLHPFYHNSDYANKTSVISGTIDISKYLRDTDCAFILKEQHKDVTVRHNDPLFYVNFKTPDNEKVQLKKFYYNDEIRQIKEDVYDMRFNKTYTRWQLVDWYNMYMQSGYKKQVLKLIKENLLD